MTVASNCPFYKKVRFITDFNEPVLKHFKCVVEFVIKLLNLFANMIVLATIALD